MTGFSACILPKIAGSCRVLNVVEWEKVLSTYPHVTQKLINGQGPTGMPMANQHVRLALGLLLSGPADLQHQLPAIANALPAEIYLTTRSSDHNLAVTYFFQRIFLPSPRAGLPSCPPRHPLLTSLPSLTGSWRQSMVVGLTKVPSPTSPRSEYIEIKSSTMEKWRGKEIPCRSLRCVL